jgi:hypothetical protein
VNLHADRIVNPCVNAPQLLVLNLNLLLCHAHRIAKPA